MKCDKSGHRLDIGDQVEIPYNQQLRRARILSIQDTDIGNLEVEIVLEAGERYQSTIVTAEEIHLVEKAVPNDPGGEVIYRVIQLPDKPPPTPPTPEEVQKIRDAFLEQAEQAVKDQVTVLDEPEVAVEDHDLHASLEDLIKGGLSHEQLS